MRSKSSRPRESRIPDRQAGRRLAIVTGALGGIGRAVCVSLSNRGFDIVAAGHQIDSRGYDLKEACTAVGAKLRLVPCDIADPEAIMSLMKSIGRDETLSAVVHCAGVYSAQPLGMATPAIVEQQLRVHAVSALSLTALASRRMKKGGSIVLVSSAIASQGLEGHVTYGMAKSALHGLVRSAARELGPRQIRVNAVLPGVIDTPFLDGIGEARRVELVAQTCLGRLGRPDDVADAIAFLACEESRFITGECLRVDGGLRL